MMKKALAILLTFTLLLGLLPVRTMAAEVETAEVIQTEVSTMEDAPEEEGVEEIYKETVKTNSASESGACGDNLTWTLKDGTLTISGTGAMYDYFDYNEVSPWSSFWDDIKIVKIESGVASIGSHAFYGCGFLTKITIPESVTDIGSWAFHGCINLTDINIPSSVVSIGVCVFNGCRSLTSVTIPSSVTAIGDSAFEGCYSLISVALPSKVTTIGMRAFHGCTALTVVTIPSSVTTIGWGAFSDCYSLTNIHVAEENTKYCSVDGVLFNKDMTILYQYPAGKGGTNYSIPDSVTTIEEYAFEYCDDLNSIMLSNGVTTIGRRAFYDCNRLVSVTIPSSVTTIGEDAFYKCKSLIDVYYGGSKAGWAKISINNDSYFASTIIHMGALDNVTITGTNAHMTGNILYWNAVPDAELYQIFRRTSGQPFEYLRCASGLGVKDETAKVGVTYIYAVRAVNGNLRSADYSNQVALTRPSNIPANVKITGKNAHKTGNILYWNSVSGAKFYQIFRRTSGQSFEWIANTGGAAYKDETANPGVTYIYAIKAHNGSVKSAAYSNTVAMTRPRG